MTFAPRQTLRTVSRGIASKVIDGEAIIIHLESGAYYSSEGTGALLWQRLADGSSLEDLTAHLLHACEGDPKPDRVASDVAAFVDELAECGLLESDDAPCERAAAAPEISRCAYTAPALAVYDDMADLLALDPPTPGLVQGLEDGGPEDRDA